MGKGKGKGKGKKAATGSSGSSEPVYIDLVDSSEDEAQVAPVDNRRHSGRLKRREQPDDSEPLLSYPKGAKHELNLTYAELRRLRPQDGRAGHLAAEALLMNDTLIDFRTRFLLEDDASPLPAAARRQVHIFSPLFTKMLGQLLRKKAGIIKLLRWVKGAKLLEKQLLFFPLHEARMGGHLSLAVCCFPRLALGLPARSGSEQQAEQQALPLPPPSAVDAVLLPTDHSVLEAPAGQQATSDTSQPSTAAAVAAASASAATAAAAASAAVSGASEPVAVASPPAGASAADGADAVGCSAEASAAPASTEAPEGSIVPAGALGASCAGATAPSRAAPCILFLDSALDKNGRVKEQPIESILLTLTYPPNLPRPLS